MFKVLLFCLFFLELSCASLKISREETVDLGNGAKLFLKNPKDVFPEIQLVQILSFAHKDKKYSSQAVLTSKDNELSIVALMPLGGEAFRVEYSNGEIRSKALPFGGDSFNLKFALSDIILVYAEIDVLKKWLSQGTVVVDSELHRTISYKNQDLIEIKYDKRDKFDANIEYTHLLRHYSIKITPLSRKNL